MRRRIGLRDPRGLALCIAALLLARSTPARPWWATAGESNAQDFLPAAQAFRVSARRVGQRLTVHWDIAPGYYLYRSRIGIRVLGADRLASPWRLPTGILRTDRYFGPQQVFFHAVDATAELAGAPARDAAPRLQVSFQGCALAGLCYPRITKRLVVTRAASSSRRAVGR
ncbi:MAG: protein-disulfide reductase DsbD N-terminal domain-containing protein [Gammaproteobacteria bacterium]|nr:protein-disulfide reductase DsbD N-terminal domain-containing protein [Gammaproteobacteria bacterium]